VSRKPPKAIHCPAGQWTRVEFYLGSKQEIHKFYEADPAAVNVQYRIYSSFLPPFQDGEFTGLLLKTMPYARSWLVKFNPASDVDVTSGLESPPPESP
jgi:hypothetical protein